MKNKKYFPIVKDNRGLTLIELIIAMAISSIVIGMVIVIISAGSRNFNIAQNEVDIQMEAQTVVNQIEDTIIEASWIEEKSISADVKAYIIYTSQGNSA
ncbi:MAG: prepilin-type N-terminal cleavage/methylation domain-containing protein, partial [Mobilitalea sp.]